MSENVRQRQRKCYEIFEKLDVTSLSEEYADLQKDQNPYFVIKSASKNFLELFCIFFRPIRFKQINRHTHKRAIC